MSDSKKTRIYFIDRVIGDLEGVSYPQPFDGKLYEGTNCMAYAIGAKTPDHNKNMYYPGGLTKKFHYINRATLVERMIQDLNLLGICCTVISEEEARTCEQPGKQIIAVYYGQLSEDNDFHVIRKDKGGTWSHKSGYRGRPKKIEYDYEKSPKENYELLAYLSLSFR